MRLDIIDDNSYKIFINSNYIKDIDVKNKDELGKIVKEIIIKIKNIYNIMLEGFYEVHVYPLKYLGIILEIRNIDNYLNRTVDLRIVVHNDEEIYINIYLLELIKNYKNIKYLNNSFYLNINDLKKEDIYTLIESSNIIYGEELSNIKSHWHNLT